MNLLKMYSPQLLVSPEGNLVIQIQLGGVSVHRLAHPFLKSFDANEMRSYFNTVVPEMIEELQKQRKDKLKKLKRKGTDENKKRREHTN